jgi:hypothetical protein
LIIGNDIFAPVQIRIELRAASFVWTFRKRRLARNLLLRALRSRAAHERERKEKQKNCREGSFHGGDLLLKLGE